MAWMPFSLVSVMRATRKALLACVSAQFSKAKMVYLAFLIWMRGYIFLILRTGLT